MYLETQKKKEQDKLYKPSTMLNSEITMEDDNFPYFSWKAYHGSVSAMLLIKIPKEYIVLGAENKHIIMIFSLFGKKHCLYNLEFPLPNLWQLNVSSFEKRKEQYERAVEMIHQIDVYKSEKNDQKVHGHEKAVSHYMTDYDEHEKPKTRLKGLALHLILDLKYKGKSDTREDNEKQQIFTFNELLTKVDSENPNNFKPCTISLRKIDARNRKILEGESDAN
jgi:hypothetical protein